MTRKLFYLNAGKGDPCAGQSREIGFDKLSLKEKDSILEENLGLALPIGSGENFACISFIKV